VKTLAQLRPRHDTIRWLDECQAGASVHRLGPPDYFYQAHHGGPHYFGWHEECYSHRDLYRPVCSPKSRRPIHACESHTDFGWRENFGAYHHWFKRKSSRRLRKALKRELNADLAEAEDLLNIPDEIEQMFLLWAEEESNMLQLSEHYWLGS